VVFGEMTWVVAGRARATYRLSGRVWVLPRWPRNSRMLVRWRIDSVRVVAARVRWAV
jgi:hypothetical protein